MSVRIYILLSLCLGFQLSIAQKKILPVVSAKVQPVNSLSVACAGSTSRVDLDINNVRALILGSADMWWDLKTAHYQVPKDGPISSIFSGSLWIGAIDNLGQLKVAAQFYRQSGHDFWPGPMDTANHVASDSGCWKYDRVWKVDRYRVEESIQKYNDPDYTIPKDILEWPGNGDVSLGEAHYMAPFFDKNADGKYDAREGDYPAYDFSGTQNCEYNLLGDQSLWWVFNDAAGVHTETGGTPLGLEIHAQAFAYQANDEINNITFYQYKAINRSTFTLDSMYWGQWIDSDLGEATDDYVGCDVKRGLGYCYNADAYDETPNGYGLHPPAVGCDFLGGPLANLNDGIDNDRDSILDEAGERIMMSEFLYYDKSNAVPWSVPGTPPHLYNYLRSKWGDGLPITYGSNGYNTGGVACHFFFPGNSDPYGWGTGGVPQQPWTEYTAQHTPQDRRYVMSAGPFTMQPGAIQFITQGIIWGRDTTGDHLAGVAAMQKADDKAQAFFDNCFSPMPCAAPKAVITYSAKYLNANFGYYGQSASTTWDFGDGTTSAKKYPAHTYASSGIYKVCLKVTTSCGMDSTCISIEVANQPPPPWGFKLKRIEGNGNAGQVLDWTEENYDSVMLSLNHKVRHSVYEYSKGPVNIGVYDTVKLPRNKYIIQFDSTAASAKWKMYRVGFTDTAYADSSVGSNYLQMIPKWGIGVRGNYVQNPGASGSINNGSLEATMSFSDPNKKWLTGLGDGDYKNYENWIRSGKTAIGTHQDYPGIDDGEDFENLLRGTWAPYRVVGTTTVSVNPYAGAYYGGPGFKSNFLASSNLNKLASVDVVITNDKWRWTRCAVFELCEDPVYSSKATGISNNARKLDFRRAPSVDKNGNPATIGSGPSNDPDAPNYVSDVGMGWFPGYAVNVETGERLNICFGENSALVNENGNDMLWNPTASRYATTYNLPWDSVNKPVFGGQHYIYIFGHNNENTLGPPIDTMNVPGYDAGRRIRQILGMNANQPIDTRKREIFADAMWVNIPLLAQGQTLLSSDVKIRLRVAKPYQKGYSTARIGASLYVDTTTVPQNNNFPMYEFDASDFGPAPPIPFEGFAFFPNPFVHSACFYFGNRNGDEHEFRVFDVQGRLVRDYRGLTGSSVTIERGSLRSGIYFYCLSWRGKKKAVGKFIVTPEQ